MTDRELDDLLRRYRPAGPPPELCARIAAGVAPAARTWPWAAAAAALLAAVCALHFWTNNVYGRVRDSVTPAPVSILSEFPALQSAVEDDPLLKQRIEAIARQEAVQRPAPLIDPGGSWQ